MADTSLSRDLPLWARGFVAIILVVIGWYAGQLALRVDWLGDSLVEASAGVVALAVIIAWKLTPGWWPSGPARTPYSIGHTIGVASVIGAFVLVGSNSSLPDRFWHTGREAIAVFALGAAAVGVGWGRIRMEAFSRWFAIAAGAAIVPVIVAAGVVKMSGQLQPLQLGSFLGSFSFAFVMSTCATLITIEFAFRRLLVGQSGDAGVVIVVMAAVASTVWHMMIPVESSAWTTIVGVFFNSAVLGCLYVLSRSLLVSALFHGVQLGLTIALANSDTTIIGLGNRFWTTQVVGVGIVAGVLGFYVFRQNGWMGAVPIKPVIADAADD